MLMSNRDPHAATHRQQATILVDSKPFRGNIKRVLSVYGYHWVPHGKDEISLMDVRVPAENLLLGEGRGSRDRARTPWASVIRQCIRTTGIADEACRSWSNVSTTALPFGKRTAKDFIWKARLVRARVDIVMTRLLCLKVGRMMNRASKKAARNRVAMIEVQTPQMALRILADAVQAHGGGGVSGDFALVEDRASFRSLRFAAAPDEVYVRALAGAELGRYRTTAR